MVGVALPAFATEAAKVVVDRWNRKGSVNNSAAGAAAATAAIKNYECTQGAKPSPTFAPYNKNAAGLHLGNSGQQNSR